MDVAYSLSQSNVLYGGEVAGCRAWEQSNLTTCLKYKCFHRKSFGDSRISSKKNSPKKLKKITTYCVSSDSTRTLNRGNFWCWSYSGSSLYNSGNLIKFSKHVALPRCQGSESVAYLNENDSGTEVIETGESENSLESNASGVTGEEGVQDPSLDELRESLQKALKELEVARLSSTMFEEKAQKISEAAIALKDEATNAWDDVNVALSNVQDIINEESIAKEVVQKAIVALSLAETRLNTAVDAQKIAKEKNGSPKSSNESDSEYGNGGEESSEEKTLMAAQQDVNICREHLEKCEAELKRVQSSKEELQKEVDRLNVVAEQAQTKANKAEEEVANIMLLAEKAVAYELEAAQCADEADIALQRAEKNLAVSSIETLDFAIEGANVEMSQGSAADVIDKDWEMPAEIAELLVPLSDGQPEESSLSYESDKENGKPTGELLNENEADEEKLKSIQSRIQEMQKEPTKETSPLSAPKALLKKSSRFFSASFFSFTADEEEFAPGAVFHGLAEFATKQRRN